MSRLRVPTFALKAVRPGVSWRRRSPGPRGRSRAARPPPKDKATGQPASAGGTYRYLGDNLAA
jgi:hypothetical protein